MIWWIPVLLNLSGATCTALHGDRILAADLARAVPEFAAVAGDAVIGYAPVPGSRRVLHAAELRRLAAKFNVALDSDLEACFEWTLRPISEEALARSMRESLELPNATIRIIDICPAKVPAGRIVFPIKGLIAPADRNNRSALWRGYILYGEKRRFDLWARVKLSASTTRVVAVHAIPVGHVIQSFDVRLDTVDDFPVSNEVARNLEEVIGRVAQRGIPAGHAVPRTGLPYPVEIEAGEMVEVDVESGGAHLKLQGRAENSGHRGDVISVRNPRSAKLFRARVDGKGRVLVVPGMTGEMVN